MADEMPKREAMTLPEALRLLADVHTQDDDLIDYTVQFGAYPAPFHQERYIEAWRIVRSHMEGGEMAAASSRDAGI